MPSATRNPSVASVVTTNGEASSLRGASPVSSSGPEVPILRTKQDIATNSNTLKPSSQTPASIEEAAPENLKQVFKALDKRRRNLEKRKDRLAEYRVRLDEGENLNKDQREAASNYEEVVGAIAFAKELAESFHKLTLDVIKEEKHHLKVQAVEKRANDLQRLRHVLSFNHVLQVISNPLARDLLLSGTEGVLLISTEEMEALELFRDSILLHCEKDGESPFSQLDSAAESLLAILEATPSKKVTPSHSYADVRFLLDRIVESGFCDTVDLNSSQPKLENGHEDVDEDELEEICQENQSPEEAVEEDEMFCDVVSSTVEDVQSCFVDSTEKIKTPPGFVSLESKLDSSTHPTPANQEPTETDSHQEMEVSSSSGPESSSSSSSCPDSNLASSIEGSPFRETSLESKFRKEDEKCYSFNLPPPRPFHQVIESVQGNFDFLQDSQIEVNPSVGTSEEPSIPGGALPTDSATSFSGASPLIDDPAVMHVTAGSSAVGSLGQLGLVTDHGSVRSPAVETQPQDSSSHLQSQYNSSSNAHASSLSSGLQGSCGIQGDLPLDTGHMAAADAYLHSKPNPENAFIKGISPASHSNLPNSLQGSHVIAAEVTKLSNQSSLSNQGSMLRHSEDFGVVGSGSRGKSTGHGLSVGNDGPTDGLSFGSEPISFGLQQVSNQKFLEANTFGSSIEAGKWPDSNLKNEGFGTALTNNYLPDSPSNLEDSSTMRNIGEIGVAAYGTSGGQQPTATLSKEDLSGQMNNMYVDDRGSRKGNSSNYHQGHQEYNHQTKEQGYSNRSSYNGGRQTSMNPAVNINGNGPRGGSGGGRWGGNGSGGGYGGRNGGLGYRGAAVRGGYGNRGGNGGNSMGQNGGQMRNRNMGGERGAAMPAGGRIAHPGNAAYRQ